MTQERPGVGIGVIVLNEKDEVLAGKRIGSHAPYWSIPGGKLEPGESFEAGAIREIQEEIGITIVNPTVIAITNNLRTYHEEGVHFISVILLAREFSGMPKICEPDKYECIDWFAVDKIPQPHFEASEFALQCFRSGTVYVEPVI